MPLDVGDHERADRQHPQTAGADVVQGVGDQPATNAAPLERAPDLRMQERDEAGLRVVVEEAGELVAEVRFVAAGVRRVADAQLRRERAGSAQFASASTTNATSST